MKSIIRLGLAAVLAAFAGTAAAAGADDFPNRAMTIVVPFSPGGSNDTLARLVGRDLEKKWKQPVVIENRTGAGGNLGALAVVRSEPDGYTMVMGSIGTHAVNPFIYKNMPYDPIKDLQPITLVAKVDLVLVVHPSLPIHSVKELIDYAKANPGVLNYASGGNGASQHLAGELFKHLAGIDMVHVPYKGSANALADLLGGQVPIMIADLPLVAAHIKEGKLRALAVGSAERSPAIDVPTMDEAGVKGYEAYAWYGLSAAAGTPQPIVDKLNAAIVDILHDPANQDFMRELGAVPAGGTPEEFGAFQKAEMAKWGPLIKPLGMKLN